MARDLNQLAAAARHQKEQERVERYEKLVTDITGLASDILDVYFPEDANGNADWDKFNWEKGEQLKQLLADLKAGRNPRRHSDDDRARPNPTRQSTAVEPAASATEPPADDIDETQPQGRLARLAGRLNQ
jgi:hypothetical protein